MRGSSHFGFTFDWYRAHKQFWVIRTLQIERACAAHYDDALAIHTWVSSMARVRSDRNYEIRRARDGRLIARGIANWVYVDAAKMMPTRIPPEIAAMFEPHRAPALPPIGKVTLDAEMPARFEHTTTRRAQFYEADSAKHINNAVYVNWMEEAVRDALRAMGCALALDDAAPRPWFYRHTLDYVRAAVPGDEIEIAARLMRQAHTRGDWQIEMRHRVTREQLLRAHSTMLWVNAAHQPTEWRTVSRAR